MTWTGRKLLAAIALAGAFALGGCAYDDGYYGGVNVGAGYYGGGYYDDYWGPSYYRPGVYGGWYNDFYYPGSGYYVYDRGGRRHRWNDGQRRYWEGRREARRGNEGRNWAGTPRPWQGDRNSWRGRDRGASAAPPTVRVQPGTGNSQLRGWIPRGRSEGGEGGRRGGGRWGSRH
jgi:hypothetical protein